MMRVYIICLLVVLIIVGLVGVGWAWFEWGRARRKEWAVSQVVRVVGAGGVELVAYSGLFLAWVLSGSIVLCLYGLLGMGLLSLLYVQIRRYRDAAREPTMKNYSWFTQQGVMLTSSTMAAFIVSSEQIGRYVIALNISFREVYVGVWVLMLVIVGFMQYGVGLILWEVGQRRREGGEPL